MRELLIRLIYCEMLGIECSWGYIHAIKMTQSSNIMDKRIGTVKPVLVTTCIKRPLVFKDHLVMSQQQS